MHDKINEWNKPKDRSAYLLGFSSLKWEKTPHNRKVMHSLKNCECCRIFHHKLTSSFPIKAGLKNVRAYPLVELKDIEKKTFSSSAKPKRNELKEISQSIYNSINKVCNQKLGKSFSEVITLVPEAELSRKESPVEKKKKSRQVKRDLKRSIEEEWAKSDVDDHLAQRVSFSTRKRQRLNQGFESKKKARERTARKRATARVVRKSHSPKQIGGNIEQLQMDVKEWPHEPVNWMEMARRYNICKEGSGVCPKNAGQVLKELLKNQGIDISPFEAVKSKGN